MKQDQAANPCPAIAAVQTERGEGLEGAQFAKCCNVHGCPVFEMRTEDTKIKATRVSVSLKLLKYC